MSVLGLMGNLEPIGPTTAPLSAAPSTPGERLGAAWDAAQSDDRYWNVQGARKERADKIIADYHAMTGEKLLNPFDNAPTAKEVADNLGQPTTVIYAKRLETLRQKTRQAREGVEQFGGLPADFLEVDSIDPSIASQAGGARARDERLSGTGNGFAGFLGGAAGEMASPHGVASMFFPVSRLPTAAAEAIGARWLATARNIGKEALLQGAVQAGVQAAASVVDYNTRKQFGTEQTGEQLAEEILTAGGGGMLFGGAFRAAHLGVLKLIGHGVEVPPAVKDAAQVLETKDLYADKNALNVPAATHEAVIDKGMPEVALGRAASVADDIVPPVPRSLDARASDIPPSAAIEATPETAPKTNAEAAQTLPPVEDGMVRVYHGGDGANVGGERHVAGTYEYAHDWGSGDNPVWYVDVPADSPWLQQVDVSGTNMPRQIMNSVAPDEVMAGARLVPGTARISEPSTPPQLQRLQKMVEATAPEEAPPMVSAPAIEEAPAVRPAGGTPEEKAIDAQVKQLVTEDGGATPEMRKAYERAAQEEKEARLAVACVAGGAM